MEAKRLLKEEQDRLAAEQRMKEEEDRMEKYKATEELEGSKTPPPNIDIEMLQTSPVSIARVSLSELGVAVEQDEEVFYLTRISYDQ